MAADYQPGRRHWRDLARTASLGPSSVLTRTYVRYTDAVHPPWQGSLFDPTGPPALGSLDRGTERIGLSPASWLEHRPSWVGGHDALFARLIDGVPWRADRRTMYERVVEVPRLVAHFGEGDELPDGLIAEAWDRLGEHYATTGAGPLRSVGMCLYRDGRDSVAWHADTNGRSQPGPSLVAIVSLGARRRLLLRPRGAVPGGRTARRFELGEGDLLVMGGRCQREWEHTVPKTRHPVGPRISIQFRTGAAV
jgi:alkylated DNA repair dioxygenase AlkB